MRPAAAAAAKEPSAVNRALGYLGNFVFYGGLVSAASFMAFVQLYSEEHVAALDAEAQAKSGEGGLAGAWAACTAQLAAARQWYGSKVREFTGARPRVRPCPALRPTRRVAARDHAPVYHDGPTAREQTRNASRLRADPGSDELLPDLLPFQRQVRMRTLVLDLDGVLVESVWQRRHGWKTVKRPGAEAFLESMAQYYELVVFSDRPHSYADPILNRIDPGIQTNQGAMIMYRLYKNSTHWEVRGVAACALLHSSRWSARFASLNTALVGERTAASLERRRCSVRLLQTPRRRAHCALRLRSPAQQMRRWSWFAPRAFESVPLSLRTRPACVQRNESMRDLTKLNRDLSQVVFVVTESRAHTVEPADNVLVIPDFKGADPEKPGHSGAGAPQDTTLLDLVPLLELMWRNDVADTRVVCKSYAGKDVVQEFRARLAADVAPKAAPSRTAGARRRFGLA